MIAKPRVQSKKKYVVSPFLADQEQIGKICTICGVGIMNGEEIVKCPECSLPYHNDCWKEMGGCASYGCAAAPDIKKADYAPADTFVEGWTSEKKCPECGSMILSNALICKVCKSTFPTEKPMTKSEWQNRIYDGDELNKIRIKVFLQFFASIIGIFTLFMIPINLVTLLTDKWIFKIHRLPKELKFLQYVSTGLSIFWGFCLLLAIIIR